MRSYIGAALLALGPMAVAAQDAALPAVQEADQQAVQSAGQTVVPAGAQPVAQPADQKPTQPWGSRDFTFHRIGVPKPGATVQLVQVDPNEQTYHLTPATPEGVYLKHTQDAGAGAPPSLGSSDWFWTGVSPALAASNPQRLDQAIGQLGLSKQSVVPAKSSVARLVRAYGNSAESQAQGTIVSPALVLAVMSVESGGDGKALSPAGAQGLMQLMPATARRFGVEDPLNTDQSIAGGTAYLNFLLRAFGEDPILAIAAYNAGEGAVAQNKGVPPYAETRAYVPKVLGAWTVARLFCKVPPQVVTDPCDFAVPEDDGAAVASASASTPATPADTATAVVPKDAVRGAEVSPGFAAGRSSVAKGALIRGSGSDG